MTFHSVVPAPRTILSGVRKLPPATVRVIKADGTSTERVYWEATFTRPVLASDGEGAMAVWISSLGGEYSLVASRYTKTKQFVAPVPINDPDFPYEVELPSALTRMTGSSTCSL